MVHLCVCVCDGERDQPNSKGNFYFFSVKSTQDRKHTSTWLYSSGGGNLIASSIFAFPHFLTKASTSLQIARTASWYWCIIKIYTPTWIFVCSGSFQINNQRSNDNELLELLIPEQCLHTYKNCLWSYIESTK